MEENKITFVQVFNIIKQKLLWILLITLAATLFLFAFLQIRYVPTYTANASMYVFVTDGNASTSTNLAASLKYVYTLSIIIKSDTVLDRVIERLDLDITADQVRKGLQVESVNETEVLSVSYVCDDPQLAKDIVNTITEEAPAEIERIINAASAKVIDPAKLPNEANSSHTLLYTAIGCLLFFALACVAFVAISVLDTKIRTEDDLNAHLSFPVFGNIPTSENSFKLENKAKYLLPLANRKKLSDSVSSYNTVKLLNTNPSFAVKEAYNIIRTNILFSSQDDGCQTIAVTGATEDVGKSTVCVNTAISFAQLGKKVLLIDADLRNPSLHKFLDMENGSGMSELLAGITKECVPSDTGIQNLSILTAGTIPPNPSELLFSPRFAKLVSLLQSHYDYIFIDTPPVNLVTDATMLAERVSGYIFVARAMHSTVPQVQAAIRSLQQVNGKILGLVLNDINIKTQIYKGNYGKYGKYENAAKGEEDIKISEQLKK